MQVLTLDNMFLIIKQIELLDKDGTSKHKMQFFIEGLKIRT